MAKTELSVDDKFELLIQALAQRQDTSITPEMLKEILAHQATAVQKAMKPENAEHPGLSVFSHPEGDKAHPKPPLPFELIDNGYPVHQFPETETWRAWGMYAQLQPGEYSVIRKDGTVMAVTITGERDANGKVTKLLMKYPILREERGLVPPKTVMLAQLLRPENTKAAFLEEMHQQLHEMLPDAV